MNHHKALVAELPHLRHYALSLTRDTQRAEDLVQDALVKALQHADQIEGLDALRPWLFRILLNTYKDDYRRQRRGQAATGRMEEPGSAHPRQEQQIFLAEVLATIDRIASHPLRLILAGCAAQLSYQEMAQRSGVPIGTVRSRVARARDLLLRHLDETAPSVASLRAAEPPIPAARQKLGPAAAAAR